MIDGFDKYRKKIKLIKRKSNNNSFIRTCCLNLKNLGQESTFYFDKFKETCVLIIDAITSLEF